jgi:demethylmenaquinone methyltransferase/2-methoxy-6-polyprenyl-1,4-benzoquinol methylase
LTALIAERVGNSGTVIGVELSAKMVVVARQKVKEGLPLTFKRASGENLPFPGGMFDRSFISLGLHEMPKAARQNTLREIYRTLKPGGSLFVLDYNLAEGALAKLAVKVFVKLAESEEAYKMLLERTLEEEIRQAGFIVEGRKLLLGGISQIVKAGKPLMGL